MSTGDGPASNFREPSGLAGQRLKGSVSIASMVRSCFFIHVSFVASNATELRLEPIEVMLHANSATVDSSGPLGEKASTAKRAFVASRSHFGYSSYSDWRINNSQSETVSRSFSLSYLNLISSLPLRQECQERPRGKASLEVCGIRAEQGWTYKEPCLGAWEGTADTNPVFRPSFPVAILQISLFLIFTFVVNSPPQQP
ncbi:conserved hypothetical protein [Coccidioides posadasii str. Silveira]|uniref:Uncharacterized protein n=1 Tax=Coccidioides posadasii (strain RMSCC 757 / Silveira) TaxID=443226 RepID=E9DK48_COCPS|nr:conserved hypothetical protein [Coccidioides posadasii str. Silveira]